MESLLESVITENSLQNAVKSGDAALVKKMLSHELPESTRRKIDPAAQENIAIRLAAQNGYAEVVKILLDDKRVDPADKKNFAIRAAAQNGHAEIVKTLFADERVSTSLDFKAMESSAAETIMKFLNEEKLPAKKSQSCLLEQLREKAKSLEEFAKSNGVKVGISFEFA
jgi:hypothetical protein